ncbi:MAG: redox-sensing transcriptional repressor Rex [Eubacteriales bacterium]|nr:redox-sensing transcriptional repressor Rex [Eubacteriales bacterium]MDD4390387.1 redox-sensing transcriptional repressor Rex [Eubacteriales bacterium]
MKTETKKPHLSIQAFQRMPYYLQYLKKIFAEGAVNISSRLVAQHFGFTEIQVRKDFAAVSSAAGIPKHGFDVKQLIIDIEELLGYRNTNEAVLVGAGAFGSTFFKCDSIKEYGLSIVAGFDINNDIVGKQIHGKPVFHSSKISELCKRMQTHIGIIAVPSDQAQEACDKLVEGGVLAIWNFSQVHLSVPEGVLVQNENMAVSLALLSKHLQDKLKKDEVIPK